MSRSKSSVCSVLSALLGCTVFVPVGVQVLSLRVNCERYVCNPYRYGSHSTQVISSVSFLTEAPLDTLGTGYQPRPSGGTVILSTHSILSDLGAHTDVFPFYLKRQKR